MIVAEWMLVALHASPNPSPSQTAYDTLGEEGLSYSLNEGEVTTLFTNADLLPMVSKIIPIVPTLRNVAFSGEASVQSLEKLRNSHPHVRFLSLEALQRLGVEHPADPVPPKPEDICCIMYTSRIYWVSCLATGMLSPAIAGARTNIMDHINQDEQYLAYLPLAHVLRIRRRTHPFPRRRCDRLRYRQDSLSTHIFYRLTNLTNRHLQPFPPLTLLHHPTILSTSAIETAPPITSLNSTNDVNEPLKSDLSGPLQSATTECRIPMTFWDRKNQHESNLFADN
ncbi:hypothetical protein BC829DRAFT_444896 [Chytridium lagenaria]|nr:hypothetical protein BC829DRAFT_444896 [Chytridium lagenaria]